MINLKYLFACRLTLSAVCCVFSAVGASCYPAYWFVDSFATQTIHIVSEVSSLFSLLIIIMLIMLFILIIIIITSACALTYLVCVCVYDCGCVYDCVCL